jgi:protein-tyrosine phosphatase
MTTPRNPDAPLASAMTGILRLPRKLIWLGPAGTLDWFLRNSRRVLLGVPDLSRSRVTDQVYVGEQFSRRGWRALNDEGVRTVVNMREEFDDRRLGADNIPTYCHLPTTDRHAPTMAHLRKGVELIRKAVSRGEKVYIHCRCGEGRAPTMAAAYLISTGLSVEEALARIRQVRPFIIITAPQLERLHEFATEHHAKQGA